jgi:hypothetical protein
MKAMFDRAILAVTASVLLPSDARSASRPDRGELYEHIATQAFADGAKMFYLDKIASDGKRAILIAQAKEECGGRYEGTSVSLIELSHSINTDKHPSGGTVNYTVAYFTETRVRWLAVETIACSWHGGEAQSVLHAALLSGTETQTVTYRFVNNEQAGDPVMSDVQRAYKIEAGQLSDQYRLPYSEQ